MNAEEVRIAWRNGFTAGVDARYGCPYRPDTAEAQAWQAGWEQGTLKRNGSPHHDEPLDAELGGSPSSDR
jgi:hypothetical protein